jgi:hypothetical protein
MPCAIKTEIHTLRWSQEGCTGLIGATRSWVARSVLGGNGPTVDGATAARLAYLVAAAQELLGEQFWG